MLTFLKFAHTPWGNTPFKLIHVQKGKISGGVNERIFFVGERGGRGGD